MTFLDDSDTNTKIVKEILVWCDQRVSSAKRLCVKLFFRIKIIYSESTNILKLEK